MISIFSKGISIPSFLAATAECRYLHLGTFGCGRDMFEVIQNKDKRFGHICNIARNDMHGNGRTTIVGSRCGAHGYHTPLDKGIS